VNVSSLPNLYLSSSAVPGPCKDQIIQFGLTSGYNRVKVLGAGELAMAGYGLPLAARDGPRAQGFCHIDTCFVLSAVKSERSQPAQRYFRLIPAMRAMRSISAGQA
jgi:hypothetical protein